MLSFVIPFVGEFGDVVWAPLSGWIMTRMYKGTTGKIAGAVTFIEEILQGLTLYLPLHLCGFMQVLLKRIKCWTNRIKKHPQLRMFLI